MCVCVIFLIKAINYLFKLMVYCALHNVVMFMFMIKVVQLAKLAVYAGRKIGCVKVAILNSKKTKRNLK